MYRDDDDEYFDENEPIVVPIEDYIDLHNFSPKETKLLVTEYLEECHARQFPIVRIIHGKGIGVQREIVHKLLRSSPLVKHFTDAEPHQGSWGATIVYLKYGDTAPNQQ